jgi:HSP20 family protein
MKNTNTSLTPRSQLGSNLQSLAEHFFGRDLFNDDSWAGNQEFVPKMNISETDSSYKVVAELPGVDEKDVEVTIEDNILRIKGERKAENEDKDEHYYRYESSYGNFERVLRLPDAINSDACKVNFKNGVLNLEIPKNKQASKVKKLKIASS